MGISELSVESVVKTLGVNEITIRESTGEEWDRRLDTCKGASMATVKTAKAGDRHEGKEAKCRKKGVGVPAKGD